MNQFLQNSMMTFHQHPFIFSFFFLLTIIAVLLHITFFGFLIFEVLRTLFSKKTSQIKLVEPSLVNKDSTDGAAVCAIACVVCI